MQEASWVICSISPQHPCSAIKGTTRNSTTGASSSSNTRSLPWERPNRIPEALSCELRRHFSEAQLVELTLRITLCGFFNKFNEALGIEEEAEATDQFAALSPRRDG
jgi:hypothetical protein